MKLMLVCTSGGHFSTMRGLESFWSSHERVWVTDKQSDTAVLEGVEQVHWLPYQAPRDVVAPAKNTPSVIKILQTEKPDLVISTGASIAVTFGIASRILGIRFVYIESISRSDDLSLSGKFVYRLADHFYVQWPNLVEKYPRATFKGYV